MLKGALYGEMKGVESDLKVYTEIKYSNKGNHKGKYNCIIFIVLYLGKYYCILGL